MSIGRTWSHDCARRHWPTSAYLDLLVGAVDHGDEHVEQHHHHGDVVDAVQHVADVLDELVVVLQHHRDDLGQPEDGPEQGLEALLHPAEGGEGREARTER